MGATGSSLERAGAERGGDSEPQRPAVGDAAAAVKLDNIFLQLLAGPLAAAGHGRLSWSGAAHEPVRRRLEVFGGLWWPRQSQGRILGQLSDAGECKKAPFSGDRPRRYFAGRQNNEEAFSSALQFLTARAKIPFSLLGRPAEPAPYKPSLPMRVAVRMKSERAAEAAAKKPGVRRVDAYTVECEVKRQCDVVKWITGAGGE